MERGTEKYDYAPSAHDTVGRGVGITILCQLAFLIIPGLLALSGIWFCRVGLHGLGSRAMGSADPPLHRSEEEGVFAHC